MNKEAGAQTRPSDEELKALSDSFESKQPQEVLAYALASGVLVYSIGMTVVMRLTRSNRVEPGHVRTFRDLAYALAGQEPRRRTRPTA